MIVRGDRHTPLKATVRLGLVIVLLVLITVICARALEVPPQPEGRVSDYTSTLTDSQIKVLERTLAAFEQETTNQIAVLIIPTLGGDSLEDYSIRLAEKWQIGQEGRDNGIILLVVMQDRKIRIEVGYGLEGALPDSLAGDIIRQVIAPRFRQGKFYEGMQAGITAIIAATKGEYHAKGRSKRSRRDRSIVSLLWPLFIFFMFISVVVNSSRRRRHYSRRRGGLFIGGPFWWGGGFGGRGLGGGGFGGGFSGGGGGFGGGGASGGW